MQTESIAPGGFQAYPGRVNLLLDIPGKRLLRILRIRPEKG
jgi:hypothetical protein